MSVVRTIEARTHGRYLVNRPDGAGPWPLLIGFHGYGETAEILLEALLRIPGADRWLVASVQALHPFYTREQRVVANWMTRQDRDIAIADNIDYVGRALRAIQTEYATRTPLVFAGFSQGGGMAYRAATHYRSQALLILGADVPPDVTQAGPHPLPPVLIGRGTRDLFYTETRHKSDLEALGGLNVAVENCVFDGGHEWADDYLAAAGAVLRRVEQAV